MDSLRAMDVAREAARQGGAAALRHWRTALPVDWKADQTPVTAADRESEAAILAAIRAAFPDHAILAEESGVVGGPSEWRWIVDPLDGTRGFSRGGTFWGPLVALEHAGQVVAGAMGLPALDTLYWAGQGHGAWRNGERVRLPAAPERWDEATLSLGEMKALFTSPWADTVRALVTGAASARGYGDVAGCAMLLDGRADAWLETGVKAWDLAALEVLVREAGGAFTAFDGGPAVPAGQAVAAAPALHRRLVDALTSGRRA
ncbi:MAG TPA: inositol monophosphatase family protein [Vicinamibacteria bacterium]|nr:inositol monophosphatase family protein [Vicinamibacteria bacterium]